MECFEELFLVKDDFERCKTLLLWHAHRHLAQGQRYELYFDPNPVAAYGRVLAVQLVYGPELDAQEDWEPVEHPGYGVAAARGLYLIARGTVNGPPPQLRENELDYCKARRQAVFETLEHLDALRED